MSFFLALLFGAVGSGYLVYAKKQYSGRFAIFGILLVVFPYFVSNALATLVVGAVLAAAPFVMEKM